MEAALAKNKAVLNETYLKPVVKEVELFAGHGVRGMETCLVVIYGLCNILVGLPSDLWVMGIMFVWV
jgi:hypothetical protein